MDIISMMLMGAYHVSVVCPLPITGWQQSQTGAVEMDVPGNVCTTKPGDTTRDEDTGKPPNRGDGRGKNLPRRK